MAPFTTNTADVVAGYARDRPDVVVMGADSRRLGALDIVAHMRGEFPECRIVLFSDRWDPIAVRRATVQLGAAAFLPPPTGFDELIAAITAAHGGGTYKVEQPARLMPAARGRLLTARELDVLSLLADGRPNSDIAARLAISPHTVKRYIAQIFDKLAVRNRISAAMLGIVPAGPAMEQRQAR